MPSFEIPDGPTTVKLASGSDAAAPRTGSVVFTVNNKAGETRAGRLSVQIAGQSKAEWFTIDGERERNFNPANSETVTVKLSVPGNVPAGSYPFRLRVVAVNDPDNDHSDGPATTAEVAAPVPDDGHPTRIWVWIVAALVVLALIGGLVWFFVLRDKGPEPTPTETATAASTTASVPDLIGKTVGEAQTSAGSDFVITPIMAVGGDKPVGQIYEQLPAANSTQNKGIPITAKIDPGIVVPNLRGSTSDDAIRQLNGLGLHVQSSTTQCEASGVAGQIINQNPGNGARVKSNSGVDITVRQIRGTAGTVCGFRILTERFNEIHKLRKPMIINR